MKMHSYAFYNGHLSTTEHRLSALDDPENASTAAAVRYPSSNTQLNEMDKAAEEKKNQDEKETLTQLREDLALELTSPWAKSRIRKTYRCIITPTTSFVLRSVMSLNIQGRLRFNGRSSSGRLLQSLAASSS